MRRRLLRAAGAALGPSRALALALDAAERLSRYRERQLPVLAYHRVAEPDASAGLYPGLVSATPAEFEAQMEYLAARRRVVSLDELLGAREGAAAVPPRSVMVTVDDAYRDFAEAVWPAMRRLGLPVTLFVPTAFPDRPEGFWWDRLYDAVARLEPGPLETPAGTVEVGAERGAAFRAVRDLLKELPHEQALAVVDGVAARAAPAPPRPAPVLGWDELRALAREGVALAAHSRSHALLTRVAPERAREEIAGSLADLRRELGSAPPALAYPSGALNDAVVGLAEQAGCRVAFGLAKWGGNDLRRGGWLRLRRILVTSRLTLPLVRAQLLPALSRHGGVETSRWS